MMQLAHIMNPLEIAIVNWTHSYSLTTSVTKLEDLTNAEFFILLLKKVHFFQFVEPCNYLNFALLPLSQRIGRMRIVGRSILKYYESQMKKDIDDTYFNYIEMCSCNNEELLKLVIMFMGVLVTKPEILQEIEQSMSTMNRENAGYLTFMINYAHKMAQPSDETLENSPIKKQKRLITKLEILEQQIEFYEDYTKQLQVKVEHLIEQQSKLKKCNQQQSKRGTDMLRRIQQLQSHNDQLLESINKKAAAEELAKAKLVKSRQLADEAIGKIVRDLQRQKAQTQYYKRCLMKYQQIEAINKELTNSNVQLQKQILNIKAKLSKTLESLNSKQLQIEQMEKVRDDLTLENDSLKLKIELIQKSFTNSHSHQYSPQQKSLVIHNPLDISSASGRNFAWFNFKERDEEMNNSQMNESLTLSIRSNCSKSDNKVQFSREHRVNNVKGKKWNETMMEEGELNNISEQKSFDFNIDDVNALLKIKEERDLQFEFSIGMISELYEHIAELRRQLRVYQTKEAKQIQRGMLFKQKIDRIFG